MTRTRPVIVLILLAACATSAGAQLSIPGMKSAGGLGGLAGLPNISGIGLNNAAGLLSYCTRNKFLGSSTDASSILGSLTKQPGVTASKDFSMGQAGHVLSGKGTTASLGDLSGQMKTQACDMVLKQAKNFL